MFRAKKNPDLLKYSSREDTSSKKSILCSHYLQLYAFITFFKEKKI